MKTEKNLMSYRLNVLTTENPSHPCLEFPPCSNSLVKEPTAQITRYSRYPDFVRTEIRSLGKGRSKIAFTLAEVLITLGIIGVVAAVTIPTLIQKYQEKVLISQLQKAYNIVDNATRELIEKEEIDNIRQLGSNLKYFELLPKYLEIVQHCPHGKGQGKCNPNTYKFYSVSDSGFKNYNLLTRYESYVLSNGMLLIFNGVDPVDYEKSTYTQCTLRSNFTYESRNIHGGGTYNYGCGMFWIDINGKKQPNTYSKDLFLFNIVQNGIIPSGHPKEDTWTQKFERGCGMNASDKALNNCTAWVLYNQNFDYFKCAGLSWKGAKTCAELK